MSVVLCLLLVMPASYLTPGGEGGIDLEKKELGQGMAGMVLQDSMYSLHLHLAAMTFSLKAWQGL
jgi:hypothetical protein